MLNLIMTHSPRMAAMATNKRLGEEVIANHAIRHRIAWLRKERRTSTVTPSAIEGALRERTA